MKFQTQIKICGITCIEDARQAMDGGATALGINLWPGSPRCVKQQTAAELVRYIGDTVLRIGVVADLSEERSRSLLNALPLDYLQLHGAEAPDVVRALAPRAFKALRIGDEADAEQARAVPGALLLLDSRIEGMIGGSGQAFDWSLAAPIARERAVILAGGLRAENVARAIHQVKPWGVDVCSGVEVTSDPRRKDAGKLRAFLRAAEQAFRSLSEAT